jgi:2'-5' RNA ligase
MKENYYIEIRYFGKAKQQFIELVNEIDNKFNLKKGHKVPHITLIQPFTTKNQRWLISDFVRTCSKHRLMKFTVDGIGVFPFFVVFAKINPDPELIEFRNQLMKSIKSYCFVKDIDRSYKPHTTIALKMGLIKFFRIWFYLKQKPRIILTNHAMRITLLKGQKILYEYDFTNRRLLNRRQALSKIKLSKTFKGLMHHKITKNE